MADERLFKPGDRFLKWQIKSVLGEGGQAHVYEAYEPFLDLPVALKVIRTEHLESEDLVQRARREARLLTRIKHENVVAFRDAGLEGSLLYIVMELLHGRDLDTVLQQYGRLTLPEVLKIAIEAAAGAAAAHAVGAVHRDIKPANLFVTIENQVKLLDLGVAKAIEKDAKSTQIDAAVGTLFYMAPEQLQATPVTHLTDIYALGTVLYEAAYRHPITTLKSTESLTIAQVGYLQVSYMPPLLSELDPTIPVEFAQFVQKCISKEPEDRWQSMGALADAARALQARLTSAATGQGTVNVRNLGLDDPNATDGGAPAGPSQSRPAADRATEQAGSLAWIHFLNPEAAIGAGPNLTIADFVEACAQLGYVEPHQAATFAKQTCGNPHQMTRGKPPLANYYLAQRKFDEQYIWVLVEVTRDAKRIALVQGSDYLANSVEEVLKNGRLLPPTGPQYQQRPGAEHTAPPIAAGVPRERQRSAVVTIALLGVGAAILGAGAALYMQEWPSLFNSSEASETPSAEVASPVLSQPAKRAMPPASATPTPVPVTAPAATSSGLVEAAPAANTAGEAARTVSAPQPKHGSGAKPAKPRPKPAPKQPAQTVPKKPASDSTLDERLRRLEQEL